MAVNVKTLNEDEFFFGHKACAGCGGSLALRIALKVLGKNTVSVIPAGCMSAVGFNYPQLCFANNSIISTFAGTASMMTGVQAGLKALGKKTLMFLALQAMVVQQILVFKLYLVQLIEMMMLFTYVMTTKHI